MIGLGNMGGRIARRVRDASLPIAGFDVSAAQAESAGVPTVASIAELAGGADVVFLSLPDSRVIEAVVYGEGGLLASCRRGQIVVDLSTAAPGSTVQGPRRPRRAGRRAARRWHLGRRRRGRAGNALDHGRRLRRRPSTR